MIRALILGLVFSYCQLAAAQGELFFDDSRLHEIRIISLQKSDWDSIVARYEREVYTPVRVVIDGTVLDSAGIRIKGNNLLNNLDKGKFQAYKLDFNEFVKGQKYDGLKKINLNNREIMANHLGYKLCRDNGIIGPRTSFSRLYFDDILIGNYLNVEQIDVTFLKQHYGNKDGNLYSASGKGAILEYMGPDKESYYYAYEKKTNEAENDYSDLINLLRFFSFSASESFPDSVDLYIDFTPFLLAFIIEMTVCKRDAFYDAGRNYYLYHDPLRKKFIYIPDDFDYSFSDEFRFDLNFQNDVSPHLGDVSNILMDKFFKSKDLLNRYHSETCRFLNHSFDPDKMNLTIDQLVEFGRANQFDFEDFSMRTTDEIRAFISKRKTSLEDDLLTAGFICTSFSPHEANPCKDIPAVYPNPFITGITIKPYDPGNEYEITLADITGRVCYSASGLSGEQQIIPEHLAAGLYTLTIRANHQIRVLKVTKTEW